MNNLNEKKVKDLIHFALNGLKYMQLDSGLFCLERIKDIDHPVGSSIRYTLMTILGLIKANDAGYKMEFDIGKIASVAFSNLDYYDLRPGDYGLCLWVDSKLDSIKSIDLINQLEVKLKLNGGFSNLEGQELAWIIIGLASLKAKKKSKLALTLLKEAINVLIHDNRSKSGMFYHFKNNGFRKRFPNFATQIYCIFALSVAAKLDIDDRALNIAHNAARALIELQLPDGGWPWIFDVEKHRIVEPFEIYSVHQDAMAPMALLTLTELVNDKIIKDAITQSLNWIYGQNVFSFSMIDQKEKLIYRSVRRKRPWHKIFLLTNTASVYTLGLAYNHITNNVEINYTCRPYHLGWILEAWCGRESILFDNN